MLPKSHGQHGIHDAGGESRFPNVGSVERARGSRSVLWSQDPAGESGSPTGLYLKRSFQMFLPGKSFEETLCRRNVKPSVLRSQRKGWKAGGQFLCGLSESPPCNSPSWLARACSVTWPRVIDPCARFLPGSPVTLWRCQVPLGNFTAAAVKAGTEASRRSRGPGPGSELGEMPFLEVSALL